MKFEWDIDKNRLNIAKHGIRFEEASTIFFGDYITRKSINAGNDHERLIAIGMLGRACISVIYTMRGNCCRIMSARRARDAEKKEYRKIHS